MLADIRRKEILFPPGFDIEKEKQVIQVHCVILNNISLGSYLTYSLLPLTLHPPPPSPPPPVLPPPSILHTLTSSLLCSPPPSFLSSLPSFQAKVIRSLLSHYPHDRPTSKQLLQNPLLPLKMEDEELQEVCV